MLYTIYSNEDDMTYIMDKDNGVIEVKGFYRGTPDDSLTVENTGAVIACVNASEFGCNISPEIYNDSEYFATLPDIPDQVGGRIAAYE